jgi:tetratricopeptide (TPR) repeat protein
MTTTDLRHGEEAPEGARLHLGIAEQGKLYALEGDYAGALFYYRKAMQMSVEAGHPEVFFRHYLECVMESLEHMGAYPEIIEYCEKALGIYSETPPESEVALRDQAHIYQKLGVVCMKSGDSEGARRAFGQALAVLAGTEQTLPLTKTLLGWIERNMHFDPRRVVDEQEMVGYFTVRRDRVEPANAVKLPDEAMQRQAGAALGG